MKNLIFKSFLMVIFFVAAQDMNHAQNLQTLIHKANLAVIGSAASSTLETTSTSSTSSNGQTAGTSKIGNSSLYPDRAGNPNTKNDQRSGRRADDVSASKKDRTCDDGSSATSGKCDGRNENKGPITDKLLSIGMAKQARRMVGGQVTVIAKNYNMEPWAFCPGLFV